jgi:hypothetical protein
MSLREDTNKGIDHTAQNHNLGYVNAIDWNVVFTPNLFQDDSERYGHYSEQDDKPSDLSMHGESSDNYPKVPEDTSPANQYKFKSNIRHRFDSMQDADTDYPPEKRQRRNSQPSDKDAERSGNTEARSYSPGPPTQSHSNYDSFAHLSGHDRLMVPLGRHQSLSSKGDMAKPLNHLSSEAPDSHYNNSDIKQSSSPTPYSQGGKSFSSPKPSGVSLPIFALNAKGSYYIPLSIDSSVISPFLNLFADDYTGPLHPVTISVNFTGPTQQPIAPRDQDREREWRQPRSGVIQQPSVIKHWRDAPWIVV